MFAHVPSRFLDLVESHLDGPKVKRAATISAAFAYPVLTLYLLALFLFTLMPNMIPDAYLELAYTNLSEIADGVPSGLTQFSFDPDEWKRKSVVLPGPLVVWRRWRIVLGDEEPITVFSEIYLPVGCE